ncbi:hypothetical protein QVD17_04209 [Tagetes erecta]|uniref:Uncharacterized protein n=1 Tax=Tagetes erecta TaxID=13708 RepID=A0AAD8LJ56_TARER|nr:hypothetical protein QVD17_04209 [Tagetes erecta]
MDNYSISIILGSNVTHMIIIQRPILMRVINEKKVEHTAFSRSSSPLRLLCPFIPFLDLQSQHNPTKS